MFFLVSVTSQMPDALQGLFYARLAPIGLSLAWLLPSLVSWRQCFLRRLVDSGWFDVVVAWPGLVRGVHVSLAVSRLLYIAFHIR